MTSSWTTRREVTSDIPTVRTINIAAFPTPQEADLVDALRRDASAWLPGLSSWVATAPNGTLVAHALLSRCLVGDRPAVALGPCAVLPRYQRQGAGSAVIRASLEAARAEEENLVLVLGHADYYPRFGFAPASRWGIRPQFEAPDEAMMALALDSSKPTPSGVLRYPEAFDV